MQGKNLFGGLGYGTDFRLDPDIINKDSNTWLCNSDPQ